MPVEPLTIFLDNGLNQDLTVVVKGHIRPVVEGAVAISDPVTVSANDKAAITLTPDVTGYLPYIHLELSCSVAPTEGTVSAWYVKPGEQAELMVNALPISFQSLSRVPQTSQIAKKLRG